MGFMNKKAQQGPIGFVVLVIIFLIGLSAIGGVLWGLWANASTTAGLTGVEAFIYDNPALIVFLAMVLGILGWSFFGGGD